VFSVEVNKGDAENLDNYYVPGGNPRLDIATLQADGKTVRFDCSGPDPFNCQQIAVSNVRDLKGNAIAPVTTIRIAYPKATISFYRYDGIPGTSMSDLKNHASFPNTPTISGELTSLEYAPDNGTLINYGAVMQGFLSVPVTGEYKFYVSSDDQSELWLSTDGNPANKVLIAREPVWASFRNYTGPAEGGGRVCPGAGCNISDPLFLNAECRYYIEVLQKEGTGGDHVSVAWQTPGSGPNPGVPLDGSVPIPGVYLSPFLVPPLGTLLAGATADEGRRFTINPRILGAPPIVYVWKRNSEVIPGATGPTLVTSPLFHPENNGDVYTVAAVNQFGSYEASMIVTVIPDDTAPHF
jgi:hypothetical protein